jgi:hypothetical protein
MRKRRLGVVFVGFLAVGLIAGGCGGDDGDETGAAAATDLGSDVSTDSGGGSEQIVVKTRVEFPKGGTFHGEVLGGSSIGDSPFCPGGTFRDQHGTSNPSVPPYGLVDRTYHCPGGGLRMGFTPGTPQGQTQAGPWKIVSGTGDFEGLQGHGQMKVTYDSGNDRKGRETFTGTVVP